MAAGTKKRAEKEVEGKGSRLSRTLGIFFLFSSLYVVNDIL
jgi:hypothetical protein